MIQTIRCCVNHGETRITWEEFRERVLTVWRLLRSCEARGSNQRLALFLAEHCEAVITDHTREYTDITLTYVGC